MKLKNENKLGSPSKFNEAVVDIKDKVFEETKTINEELVCGIDDVPPWYLCFLLGIQQFLMMFGGTISVPFILFPLLCAHGDQTVLVRLISTISFVAGLSTILQTSIGVRLPIVQGGTFTFLVPTIAILSLPKWTCLSESVSQDNTTLSNLTSPNELSDEDWKLRIREIQGAVMVASCFEVIVPLTGILGFILRFVGPLTIAPTITLIGVALFETAANYSGKHWYIAIATIVLITIFSQYLKNVGYTTKIEKMIDGHKITAETKIPIFALYPVLLAMGVSWIICLILTETNTLPDDPTKWGYGARTDIKSYLIREANWFRIPYPGQWGRPTVSIGAVFGILAGILASMVESVGDYYACAKLCGVPPPPSHAVNRGLFMEGCAGILSGAWGSGNGTTSYSQNVGAIGLTKEIIALSFLIFTKKVASRRVIFVCGFLLILAGSVLKFSALVASLPEPVLGGALMVLFGMIVNVGLSNLQHVNLSSSRTSFIVGTSLLFGLSFPFWMSKYGKIDTGVDELDQIFTVICSTSMFVGGLVGFVLDNTIPGTKEERGLLSWHKIGEDKKIDASSYDIPYLQNYIDSSCLRYVPILSNHRGNDENTNEHVESSHL